MIVTVDRGRCVSSGNCAATAPEVFDQNEDDGIVVLLDERPPGELAEQIALAAELCPVRAISLQLEGAT